MTSEKQAHYLRSHRRRLGLSQREVAWLMGSANGANVSKYEKFASEPTLRTVLAFEIIFQVPAREIFAGIFEAVEMVTYRRAHELIRELERHETRSPAKLDALRAIVLTGAASCAVRSDA